MTNIGGKQQPVLLTYQAFHPSFPLRLPGHVDPSDHCKKEKASNTQIEDDYIQHEIAAAIIFVVVLPVVPASCPAVCRKSENHENASIATWHIHKGEVMGLLLLP